jgi:hypothetical protein
MIAYPRPCCSCGFPPSVARITLASALELVNNGSTAAPAIAVGSSRTSGPFTYSRPSQDLHHLVIVGLKDPQGFHSLVHKVKELVTSEQIGTPVHIFRERGCCARFFLPSLPV